ncbi:imidazole glycerol phosphate synthase subunit HisH [Gammaproteobacteria bacterium]|nr:imidazole glycerol phosphate synthase subunit HisH [Gammaproteobacteria bacterium]
MSLPTKYSFIISFYKSRACKIRPYDTSIPINHLINIAIIDYGMGNTHSLTNSIKALGYINVNLTFEQKFIQESDCIILPGVGAFGDAMKNLKERNLIQILDDEVQIRKKPILGICLGMQLLFESSDEHGFHEGLGWIPGKVEKMEQSREYRIPHVGWNNLKFINNSSLLKEIKEENDFYFVHSYHANCEQKYILAKIEYGKEYTAIAKYENVLGMQFHPEKSHHNGLLILKTFLESIT